VFRDNCPGAAAVLTTVTSDEAADGTATGDGSTVNHIQVADIDGVGLVFDLGSKPERTWMGGMTPSASPPGTAPATSPMPARRYGHA
jgi:hypothetical protein